VKRFLDIIISAGLLAALSPILGVIAILIRWQMGTPILFTQKRPGLRAEPFTLYKFRTMSAATDSDGNTLPDLQRLTTLGRFLRASSLDELPELWNVLRGEMSLVGPRPLLMEYLPRYSPEQARRHEVKPGLTGWAQINGRNALTWEQRFALDIWYIENRSLWLDIKILLLTLWYVVRREGISHPGHATMEPFEGSRE